MKIDLIVVGSLKEKYFLDAQNEYVKRLKKFCTLDIVQIKDSMIFTENDANIKTALEKQGKNILSKIKNQYVILLDINGNEFSTIDFANHIERLKNNSISEICFIIGGSYGVSDDVKQKSNFIISFSKMTFMHQLFRILFLEQIYRVFKIINNEPYHK